PPYLDVDLLRLTKATNSDLRTASIACRSQVPRDRTEDVEPGRRHDSEEGAAIERRGGGRAESRDDLSRIPLCVRFVGIENRSGRVSGHCVSRQRRRLPRELNRETWHEVRVGRSHLNSFSTPT